MSSRWGTNSARPGDYFVAIRLSGQLLETVDAVLVGCDDIQSSIAVHVTDAEMEADAAAVVDQVFVPGDSAARAGQFVPAEDAWFVGSGVVAVVGPVAFARDEIHQAVSVHVGQVEGMRL